jgi:hypothetical protein
MSIKRNIAKLATATVALLAITVALPGTAFADVITVGGPPAGTGGGGAGGVSHGNTMCGADANGNSAGFLNGKQIYLTPYAGCIGTGYGHPASPPWGVVDGWGVCLASYVVWDFYGNESGPADGVYISVDYLPQVCKGASANGVDSTANAPWQQIDAFSPNPLDNGSTTIFSGRNGQPGKVDPFIGGGGSDNGAGQYYVTTNSGDGHTTTSSPFWHLGETCNQAINQNPDPLATLLASPNGSTTASAIWTTETGWANQYGWAVANALSDTVSPTGPTNLTYQSNNFLNPNNPYPDCTSGFTMQSPATVAPPDRNFYGACVMSVSEFATVYKNYQNNTYQPVYPVIGGDRWDIAPGQGAGSDTNLTSTESHAMRSWIYSSSPPINVGLAYPSAFYNSPMNKAQAENMLVANPWQPSVGGNGQGNPQAALYSNCFRGGTIPNYSNLINPPPQNPQLTITATAPNPLIVGGKLNPETFSATSGTFTCATAAGSCSQGPGSTPPKLVSLSYTLTPTGTSSYNQCIGNNTANCQYEVISTTRNPATGLIESSTKTTAGFFTATSPTQKVNLKLTNVSATYQYSWFDGTVVQVRTKSFSPTLVGANISRSVIAGTQSP